MTYCFYERLSATDATFLDLEDHNSHMHIGSVALFDAQPLRGPDGGVDLALINRHLESALAHSPRFRQRLAFVPGFGRPVWIDDASFNLHYHVRHTALPAPGDERLLKRLAGRIMSQQLDRGKPLWEMWVVEGVTGDRFALVTKLHHCIADGISGVDLAASVLGTDPDFQPAPPRSWIPRPAPSGARLLGDELRRRVTAPLSLLAPGERGILDTLTDVKDAVVGVAEAVDDGRGPASETPFDTELGPHRRFDWARVELSDAKKIREAFGGTLNDVVLAVVAGALRRFLRNRGLVVEKLNFRVFVPVSVRNHSERGTLGNRVSMMLVRLPLEEGDSVERLHGVTRETAQRKSGHQTKAVKWFAQISDALFPELTGPLARIGVRTHAANMVVTNVPGPAVPVYLLGSRQLEAYPVVPLAPGQALGIALLSYAGGLHWGFNSDWDALPDLHDLVEATLDEFSLLVTAARSKALPPVRSISGKQRAAARRRRPAAKRQPGR